MKSECLKTDTFLVKQINDVLHVMIRQIPSRMLPCIFIAMWLYRDNRMHPGWVWTSPLMFRVTVPLPPVLVAAWLGILAQLKRAAAWSWCWCWLVAACDGAQVDIYDAAEVRQGEGRAFTHHNITSLCLNWQMTVCFLYPRFSLDFQNSSVYIVSSFNMHKWPLHFKMISTSHAALI